MHLLVVKLVVVFKLVTLSIFRSYSEGSQYSKHKFAYLGNPPAWQLPHYINLLCPLEIYIYIYIFFLMTYQIDSFLIVFDLTMQKQ